MQIMAQLIGQKGDQQVRIAQDSMLTRTGGNPVQIVAQGIADGRFRRGIGASGLSARCRVAGQNLRRDGGFAILGRT
ncbi:hypothetical protein CUV01_19015 (plasmid) [Paracoccus tegillarcae]|uniref:Uncharacterized protein n=1 Tax=Paracoccus tegillarcae TaxID=1529068 RepID=A0A2K9EV68_9RHOB|nr:hypothetical protein CUV01_19015 [Paracoccus tegillarcae]